MLVKYFILFSPPRIYITWLFLFYSFPLSRSWESIRLKWIRLHAFRSKQVFEGHLSRYFYTTDLIYIHCTHYTYMSTPACCIYVFMRYYIYNILVHWLLVRVVCRESRNLLAVARQILLQRLVPSSFSSSAATDRSRRPLNTRQTTSHTFLKLFYHHKPGSGYYII